MSRIFSTKSATILGMALLIPFASATSPRGTSPAGPILVQPLKTLFNHKAHTGGFQKLGIRCTDCHTFAVKPRESGPVGSQVPAGFLKPSRQICHQCHLGHVAVARPNQCLLCHLNTDAIKPEDHLLGWRIRHGRMAQMDRQSCAECHTTSSCNQCHAKVDVLNPQVHAPNYRLMHSIHARANPQSCVQCHKSVSFCKDCHSGASK
jgi:hypothetical protein